MKRRKRKKSPQKASGRICDGAVLQNEILRSIPDKEWQVISRKLRTLQMPSHLVLHEPHQASKFLYFPQSGLISLVVFMQDGRTVEAGIVGNEGIVGMPAMMGYSRHPLQEVVQISGAALRIPLADFRKLAPRLPQLLVSANRYLASLGLQVAQTAACNRVHDLEQRLARWLLMAHDRVGGNTLAITQDFLATMLGTDRPSVTLAEGVLAGAAAIEHARGVVKLLDRQKLESCSCECYRVILQHGLGTGAAASGGASAGAATLSKKHRPGAAIHGADMQAASSQAAGGTTSPAATLPGQAAK
jgi:CRP-like cAMP-binding protein